MKQPESLAQRMFLLALDPDKGRTHSSTYLRPLIRSAVLTELYLSGHLRDDAGKPAVEVAGPCADPVLAGVLQEIGEGRPRRWQHWVGRQGRQTTDAVRDQLIDGGLLRAEPRRVLGLFPSTYYTLRDPRVRSRLTATVSAVLRDPVGRVDPADAALVSLSVLGQLHKVVPRAKRKEHKQKIKALTEVTGPAAPALKKTIDTYHAAAAG
ncbi:GOLPH3/VPS74 family protein [Actinocorallia sp. A-T 12471]|uniref:GOLPH3/VPS74 family protein n=1 Tax=Actinocorallia sp. A-T 12471 TaxID=3089813 RepID=UPI0029CB0389|nr:GPP34 family phosphoprotein [Actinocorallia sp. A-T 12471]MDX6740258.1 GPP34 family phosphoprotein [Actinocorallia sp. A-T 12471]